LDRNNSVDIVINNIKSEDPVQKEKMIIKNINHSNINNTFDTPVTADITSVLTSSPKQQLSAAPLQQTPIPPSTSLVSETNKKSKKQEEAERQSQAVYREESTSSSLAHSTIPLNTVNPSNSLNNNSKSNEKHHNSVHQPYTILPIEFEEPPPNYNEIIHESQQSALK